MLTRRNTLVALLIGLFILAFSGCVLFQGAEIPETPEGKYLAARIEFNSVLTRYLDFYDKADAEVQAKCYRDVDPLFDWGHAALSAWSLGLRVGTPTAEYEAEVLKLKNEILVLLFDLFGWTEGG